MAVPQITSHFLSFSLNLAIEAPGRHAHVIPQPLIPSPPPSPHTDPIDDWNQRFSGSGCAYGEQPNDFLREQAAALAPGRSLCLAEGEGRPHRQAFTGGDSNRE
jgi:hypothetical protein